MAEAPVPAPHKRDLILDWLLDRLDEQSTWRGLIGLTTVLGINLAPAQKDAILSFGFAAIGLINVFRTEHKGKTIIITAPAATVEATK